MLSDTAPLSWTQQQQQITACNALLSDINIIDDDALGHRMYETQSEEQTAFFKQGVKLSRTSASKILAKARKTTRDLVIKEPFPQSRWQAEPTLTLKPGEPSRKTDSSLSPVQRRDSIKDLVAPPKILKKADKRPIGAVVRKSVRFQDTVISDAPLGPSRTLELVEGALNSLK